MVHNNQESWGGVAEGGQWVNRFYRKLKIYALVQTSIKSSTHFLTHTLKIY